jgi:transposase-like protein
MGRIRRRFDAQFKMRVCQAIQTGQQTVAEISREHQLSRTVVSRWLSAFATRPIEDRPNVRERELERENEKLKAKIGELTMLVDALKKMEAWKRRQQSVNSSVITASNLAQFQKPAEPPGSPSPRITTSGKPTRR